MTVYHRGFHGDLNETLLVGDKVDEASLKLIKTTHECLYQAIKIGKNIAAFIWLLVSNLMSYRLAEESKEDGKMNHGKSFI